MEMSGQVKKTLDDVEDDLVLCITTKALKVCKRK